MHIEFSAHAPRIPHVRHWQFCVGSGHALLALRTDYVRQLRFIHEELGIERVRFHGIFDDDMRTCNDLSMQMPVPGSEAFEEYNFNAVGLAYDNVLDAGMKPFVELSFMPEKLALREEGRPLHGAFFYKPCIVPPKDTQAWQSYLQAFLSYLIHRYGIDEIRTWYFEVWNEPDLPVAFWNGTRDEYFRFYTDTVRAIKGVDPALQVGGPATSNSKWITGFLQYCRDNDVPVDFVSTHQYAGDPLGGVEDQGEDAGQQASDDAMRAHAAQMMQALSQVKEKTFLQGFRALMPDKSETTLLPDNVFRTNVKVARQQAGNLPLFYTEWNENAIFSAYTNDTRKVAAYDVRAALDVAPYLDGSSIWCFSDIFEELHPFPQEFHGGFGMLTQHGIPKPVFHAMKMLYDAGDERLDLGEEATQGEVGYAAFMKEDCLQILLFRQKMQNVSLPPEPVQLVIHDIFMPRSITMRRIDETHGNPLSLWEEMGSPEVLNRAEVQDLIHRSSVTEEPCDFTCQENAVHISLALGVNDVYFLTLRP